MHRGTTEFVCDQCGNRFIVNQNMRNKEEKYINQ